MFYVSPPEAARVAAAARRPAARRTHRAAPPRRGVHRVARRRFQLPPLPPHPDRSQTILQPQFAPDVLPARAMNLPEVFFWTPATRLPQFIKPFVLPGHQTQPTAPRMLDSDPVLAAVTAPPAPLSIPPIRDSVKEALLLLPPPSLPIRTSAGERRSTDEPADPAEGDPTTLLSLSTQPPPLREFLAVPAGNVVGKQPETGGSGALTNEAPESPPAGNGGTGRGAGASPGGSPKPVAGAMPETNPPSAVASAPPAAAPPPSPGSAAGAASAASPAPPQPPAPPASASRSAALAAAAATRLVHPASGVFDVVVQSGGLEGFTESAGILSGRPVYSVFVSTGAAKDWILQYCIPAEDEQAAEQSGAVVRLGNPSPLNAPYPVVTTRPPLEPRPGGYVMVHGYVTPAGRFQNLRVLGKVEPRQAELVVEVLEQWEFRPASRDGSPLRVEILLAIPTP